MPTKRFLNLHEEKRQRITAALIHEFSAHGIDDADVAGIVKEADIPRGSFYQYFEDKDDAIFYIIDLIKNEKLSYFSDVMNSAKDTSFIDFYQGMFFKALEFAANNPDFVSIGAYVITSRNPKVQELLKQGIESFYPYYEGMIEKDKAGGILRRDIDNKTLILLVSNVTSDIAVKLVYERHTDINEVKAVFEGIFKIIREGIFSKEE